MSLQVSPRSTQQTHHGWLRGRRFVVASRLGSRVRPAAESSYFFLVSTFRVCLLLLFFGGSKGDELPGGSSTGRPQERGRMSRNTSLLLDLDLARVLLLDEGNVRIVLHLLFKQLNFKHSRWLRRGRLGSGPFSLVPLRFFFTRVLAGHRFWT